MARREWLNVLAVLSFISAKSNAQMDVCGRPPRSTKIIGGGAAQEGSWPWQASLQNLGIHVCGGSLINKEWLLSAAHCFTSTTTAGWSVSLGRQNLEETDPNEVTRTVAVIILHPLFDSLIFNNDIALLRLSSAVTFTNYIRPVCLAADGSVFNTGTKTWVTGWGDMQEGDLQEVQVPIVGNRQCKCLLGVDLDSMICAGFLEGGKDTCLGDSGGPMVTEQDSIWIQSGIISFGFGCAQPNQPGVYTRVSSYQSWINSRISTDKPGFVQFKSDGPDIDSTYTCPGLPRAVTDSPPTAGPDPEPISSAEVCGSPTLKTQIVGGVDAQEGSWPWQASVQIYGAHICGGSLINREWVMSAAHCFSSQDPFGWAISLGRQNLQGNNLNQVSRTVDTIFLHPYFNALSLENDIALLRLSSPITFTDYIRPVCLASHNSVFNNGTDSWVTGWGEGEEGVPIPFPGTLQEVELLVLGNRQCSCLIGVDLVTDNMICAGFLEGRKDNCLGNSGGPMVSKQDLIWIQSGIISCAQPSNPGVYTRVSRYQFWIDSHISTDKPGFVQFKSSGIDTDSNYTCPLPSSKAPSPKESEATSATPSPTLPSPTGYHLFYASNVLLTCYLCHFALFIDLDQVCGTAPLNSRVGGERGFVAGGTWPWVVSLHKNGSYACAGTLITSRFILTSAECFSISSPTPGDWTAYLGQKFFNRVDEFEMSSTIDKIILSKLPGSNIAVLRLTKDVSLNDYLQPVCLDITDDVSFPVGTRCWTAGWGKANTGFEKSEHLRELGTVVVSCGRAASDLDNICTSTLDLQQAAVVTTGTRLLGADIEVFSKMWHFGAFLKEIVGDIPSPATTSSAGAPRCFSSFLLFLVTLTSVYLVLCEA
ncbi:transmembrane protease serine 9-like isoform X2 [Syngnathus acus]|uniref:transmembrane protease serine 9-like isoform X2 n=1 Tax=Syngnathus acus TaxID=161584 RepID=UPI001886189C|nr:transmembrane protease serine 9-like isoform X2 [Syngnathus acus]